MYRLERGPPSPPLASTRTAPHREGWTRLKRWLRVALIVVAVIVVIVALQTLVCRPKPIPVEVVKVEKGDVEDAVSNSQAGTLKARRRSRLGAERAGRVVSITHREGESVTRGEALVLLDTSTASNQVDVAARELDVQRANLASAKAAFELAETQFNRVRELHERKVVADAEMEEARSRYDEARAARAAAEAAVKRALAATRVAGNDLQHMSVVAPYAGVVAQRLVEVGEPVIPGQAVIEIVSLDELYVSASIDEVDTGRLRPGLPARVTLDPYRGVEWRGTVSRVFPVVDDRQQQNRTLPVEVDMAPDPGKPTPRPGSSADVVIVIATRSGVLRVPTFALLEDKRVLLLERGKAVSRDVQAGLRNWEWTEIRSGLHGGESVITSVDKEGVRPGARVQARAPTGAAAAEKR